MLKEKKTRIPSFKRRTFKGLGIFGRRKKSKGSVIISVESKDSETVATSNSNDSGQATWMEELKDFFKDAEESFFDLLEDLNDADCLALANTFHEYEQINPSLSSLDHPERTITASVADEIDDKSGFASAVSGFASAVSELDDESISSAFNSAASCFDESWVDFESQASSFVSGTRASQTKRMMNYDSMLKAIIKFQAIARGKILRDKIQNEARRKAAVRIQSHTRGWLARNIIRKHRESETEMAVKIQALARGWLVRLRKTKHKKAKSRRVRTERYKQFLERRNRFAH